MSSVDARVKVIIQNTQSLSSEAEMIWSSNIQDNFAGAELNSKTTMCPMRLCLATSRRLSRVPIIYYRTLFSKHTIMPVEEVRAPRHVVGTFIRRDRVYWHDLG
jgi:hypothetical protein